MKFKKVFIFALLIATSLVLVACGGGTKTGPAVINNSGEKNVTLRIGTEFNPNEGITAVDAVKGNVTDKITVEGTVDVNVPATYNLTYKVTGSDGVEFEYKRTVEVKDVVLQGLSDRKITVGTQVNLESGVNVIDPILGTLQASRDTEYFDIVGEVNHSVAGDYQIVYTITIEDFVRVVTRTIHVVNEATINVPGDGEVESYEYGSNFNPLLNVTATIPVEWNKLLQARDEDGELLFDSNDKPVYVQAKDEDGELLFDEDGEPVYEYEYDEDGNPVMVSGNESATKLVRVSGSVNTEEVGEYVLTYKIEDPDNPLEFVKDINGEEVVVTRTIRVYILVEIRGLSPIVVTEGKAFNNNVDGLEGVSGYDSILGNITENIMVIGTVNTNRVGTYELTYLLTGSNNVTDQKTRTVTVVPPISGLQTIVIMSGDVTEHDPFHPDFKGSNAQLRQQLHEDAEEKYNVKIVYEPYPANAAWGPDRVSAMIQASTAGAPLADIFYHVTTDWLGQLSSGGAIAPIDSYLDANNSHEKINQMFIDAGAIAGNHYAFSTGSLNLDAGLYFNVDLLNELGIPNPAELYLGDGETNVGDDWRWSDFKAWAIDAQTRLKTKGEDYYTLGGAIAYYGENLVPLNGGKYLDMLEVEVKFNDEKAMETYDFIHELFKEQLFEKNRTYDQGSAEWQAGKVLMHPGNLWFVTAANRWGDLGFELGFVPYPMSDSYEGEYISPIYGTSVAYLGAGHSSDKRALTFEVWNAIQVWESELDPEEAYRLSLATKFDDELYIDAYMTVYDKTYVEFLNSIGVGAYSPNSLKLALNNGIVNGEYRSVVESIVGIYQTFLQQFTQGN